MKILGIFRGFPGLGRVVSGVSLLEELRDKYNCEVKAISYLQGSKYLSQKGFDETTEVSSSDYCSIGLLPTNKMGANIHALIKSFQPDLILIDGEPLVVQSIKLSHPNIKVVVLLNPSDVDNPVNDKEAMDYFNAMYSLADLAIVHGLRKTIGAYSYNHIVSIPTILRREILSITQRNGENIYCVLGGGTVNSNEQFIDSSIRIAQLCILLANNIKNRTFHIVCSCEIIANVLSREELPANVILHEEILSPMQIFSDSALVITRSGRNTLSEVAYLGTPTISFIAGDSYRKEEQLQNANSNVYSNITTSSLDVELSDLIALCEDKITSPKIIKNHFKAGNQKAIESILSLFNEH